MTDFERRCYGMSAQDIRTEYMEGLTARISGLEMVVMSLLSDAQETMHFGDTEASRQYMNRAKFILSEMMEAKETV